MIDVLNAQQHGWKKTTRDSTEYHSTNNQTKPSKKGGGEQWDDDEAIYCIYPHDAVEGGVTIGSIANKYACLLASAYDLRKNKKDGHSEDKTPEEPTSLEFPRDVCSNII